MNILVFAPHPDDEILGCGGTLAKQAEKGANIIRCIVTSAYKPDWSEKFAQNRKKEIEKVGKIIGIKKTYELGFPAAKLDTLAQKEINEGFIKIVDKVKPSFVYIPFGGDLHKDHRLVHESALVATRQKPSSCIRKIYAYETLSETEWGVRVFIPTHYEDIEKTFSIKIRAMKAYGSELRPYPHPRSLEGVKILAQKRGTEIGRKYCEAFETIRTLD